MPETGQQTSVRDQMAMAALASGLCRESAPEWALRAYFGNRTGIRREEIIAAEAYAIADAMMALSTRKGGSDEG